MASTALPTTPSEYEVRNRTDRKHGFCVRRVCCATGEGATINSPTTHPRSGASKRDFEQEPVSLSASPKALLTISPNTEGAKQKTTPRVLTTPRPAAPWRAHQNLRPTVGPKSSRASYLRFANLLGAVASGLASFLRRRPQPVLVVVAQDFFRGGRGWQGSILVDLFFG